MAKKNDDKKLLTDAMKRVEKGIFETVDPSLFDDETLAEAFNNMVLQIADRNNRHLMRINESMRKIGDGSWIKNIIEIVTLQQEIVARLNEVNKMYSNAVNGVDRNEINAMTLVRQLNNSIEPCIEGISEIINEGDHETQADVTPAYLERVAKYRRLLSFSMRSLMAMRLQSEDAISCLKKIYDDNAQQYEFAKPLIDEVKKLTDSCNQMSLECFNAGHHMYEISRIVDEERNDMFRYNSALSSSDSFMIYAVDHLVLTWRLYNHIQEYEMLLPEQVNNPEGCKLGIWLNRTSPEWVRKTKEYRDVFDKHDHLHKIAVDCYKAKEGYEMQKAMAFFEEALGALNELLSAINVLSGNFKKKETETTA